MASKRPETGRQLLNQLLDQKVEEGLELRKSLPARKMSDDDLRLALEMIAEGQLVANVCATFGLSRNYFSERACRDKDFGEQLRFAKAVSAEARLERIEEALWDSDLTDQRAAAIAQHYRWLAGKLDRQTFGDKLEVEQRTLQIVMQKDDTNLC